MRAPARAADDVWAGSVGAARAHSNRIPSSLPTRFKGLTSLSNEVGSPMVRRALAAQDDVAKAGARVGAGVADDAITPFSRQIAQTKTVPNAAGKIISFTTTKDQFFYRVYSGDSKVGSFLTSVKPKSAAFAEEALALPPGNSAEFVQRVLVPSGTRLQRSRAAPAFGRRGGAEQFQLLEKIPVRLFGPGKPLK